MFTFELWLHKCESENFLLLRQRNNSVSFTDVTPRPTAALGGTMLYDLKSTSPTLLLSHISNKTLRNILPPASSHSWSWLACCAPVSLSSPSVCRAAVGVNGNKCQSLTIAGTLFSPALICCSDLLFRFSPLTLFFTSWAMNNKLLDAALWYGGSSNFEQTWSHKAFTRAQF